MRAMLAGVLAGLQTHGRGEDGLAHSSMHGGIRGMLSPVFSVRAHADAVTWIHRQKFRAGYFQLLKYLLFTSLYFSVLYVQMRVDETFEIDDVLRKYVVDQEGSLQDVQNLGDFFVYLQDQIIPNVFPSEWYNGDPLSTPKEETGFVLGYNKLVGGLLLAQTRSYIKTSCKEPAYEGFRSSYEQFYPTCLDKTQNIEAFVNKSMLEEFPSGTKRIHPEMGWEGDPGWTTFVPWSLKVVKDPITNKTSRQVLEPSPPRKVDELTRNDAKIRDYRDAFTYTLANATKPPDSLFGLWFNNTNGQVDPQPKYGAFQTFLKLSDGETFNRRKIEFLKDNLWLDKFTDRVYIKFAVYNGMLRMFTFVKVSFGFHSSGTFLPFDSVYGIGGTKVEIKSVNMEPYRLPQRENCTQAWTVAKNASCYAKTDDLELQQHCAPCDPGGDQAQVALEVLFMIWLFFDILAYVRNGIAHAKVGWEDYQDPVMDDDIHPGFKSWLYDLWTWLDGINYALFVLFIFIRVSLISMIVNKNNAIRVPVNTYQISLEYAAEITSSQLQWNFFNIVICLIRTFKFYRFQPRLAIVNQTLTAAAQDLFHFMLMFFTFMMGFAVLGHILFGPEMRLFCTFFESLNSAYISMLSAYVPVADMSHADGTMSVTWYLLFIFLVGIILLNVLLAILVDSYVKAKEEVENQYIEDGYETLPSILVQLGSYQIIRHIFQDPRAVHEDFLLESLRKVKEEKENEYGTKLWDMTNKQRCVTIQEILEHIPLSIRIRGKITVEKIARASVLQFWFEEREEEENSEDENLGDFHEEEVPLDPQEEILYQRIQELIQENEMLHMKHGACVAKGILKAHDD